MSCQDYSDMSGCQDSSGTSSCNSSQSESSENRGHRRRRLNESTDYNRDIIPPGIYDHLPGIAVPYNDRYRRNEVGVPGLSLRIPINPVSNLVGLWSRESNAIQVSVQRRNGIVTMQWESFSGLMGGRGLKHIAASISFRGLPISEIREAILVEYRGVIRQGYIRIDPRSTDVIEFHQSLADNEPSEFGDRIVVYGRSITWITNH